MTVITGMSPRDLKIWAKEEIISSIDDKIKEFLEFGRDGQPIDLEDEQALKIERDRVAKFFNLPVKYAK